MVMLLKWMGEQMGYDYQIVWNLDAKVSKSEFDAIRAKYLKWKLGDKDKDFINCCDMTTNDNEREHAVFGEEQTRWVDEVDVGWKFLAEVANGEIFINGQDDDGRSMMVFKDGGFKCKTGSIVYGSLLDNVMEEFGKEMPTHLRKAFGDWVETRRLLKEV